MAFDQVANFVRGVAATAITSTDTSIAVGDASSFPDPSNGAYNLVVWNDDEYARPDLDPNVEVIRVTGRDTSADTLTVTRGQEGTGTADHASGVVLALSPTAKLFGDIHASLSDLESTKLDSADYNPESDTHSKTTSASELTDVSPDSDASAHHSRYSDSEARSAVDSDVDNAANSVSSLDDAVAGKLDSADYNPESDTHSKTTSASELTDVSPDSDASAHHSKTTSASDLTDVSADSVSDAHHSRYADSEAVSAVESASSVSLAGDLSVGGGLTTSQPVTHSTDITSEFTVPSGEGIVLAGPISGESNITGDGNVAVVDPGSNSITTESDVLNVINTDSTHSADAYHSHTDLVDISSGAHHSKTTSASALTDVSADSVSDAHHSRYTDSEAQAAADGSIDAESVDGYDIQKNGTDGQGIINFKT